MISNPIVRKAVQVEYTILRLPLAAVNRGLASRLGDDSKVRLTVERGLGSLDAVAEQLLSPGSQEPRRSEPERSRAPRPRPRADTPANDEGGPTHDEQVQRVAEELLDEQGPNQVVGELADPALDVADVQAELRAKHLVEEHEAEQRQKREHEERVKAAARRSRR